MSSAHPPVFPVLKIEGPPGSGKTRELAREACRLIVQDACESRQMLLLTETFMGQKRLSQELRVEAKLAGLSGNLPQVQTQDRWLLGILAELSPPAPSPPVLLRDSEAQVLLQEILRQVIPHGHPLHYAIRQGSASRAFLGLLFQLQVQGISAEEVQARVAGAKGEAGGDTVDDPRLPLLAEIYRRFEERTRAGNLLCYAQLVHRVLGALASSPPLLPALKERYAVLLVDEAQELSAGVYQILALLGSRLILAGNEKLSIRKLRGAAPEQFVTLDAYRAKLGPEAAALPVTFQVRPVCFRGNEAILELLNVLLPQPVWQSQTLDTAQLQESVKFGYFADPQQEAERTAAHLADFVRQARVVSTGVEADAEAEGRPTRWTDCVVLLRSAHYKQHLMAAFQQQGIPFRWEVLSETLVRLQHGIYDLLKVLEAWRCLGITPAQLEKPETLGRYCSARLNSAEQQALWAAENNRHLVRALETLFLSEPQIAELRHLPALAQGGVHSTGVSWLLPALCDRRAIPAALQESADNLRILYERMQISPDPLAMIDSLSAMLVQHWANDPDQAVLTEGFLVFKENLARLCGYYQSSFSQPLPLAEVLEHFPSLWDGAERASGNDEVLLPQQVVRILSFHQVQGEEFPLVLIPFLVSGEMPHTRELPELLPSDAQDLLGVSGGYQVEALEEARLLAVGMSRATQQVWLSGHAEEGTERILPSPFYMALLHGKRRLLNLPMQSWVCQCLAENGHDGNRCSVDYCLASESPSEDVQEGQELTPLQERFSSQSPWARLERQPAQPLFAPEETINISASSIKTYMQCPRQFYYKHLLRLPQPGSDAAALGTLVHRVMEVFNRQAPQMPYTAQSLENVAERLFLFEEDPDAFYAAGFQDRDRQSLSRLSALGLSQLRQRLLASVKDLADKGYFERYGSLRRVYPERTLESVAIPGIERARFRGSMDAVIELADGSVEILDYKTFRSAYGASLETCDKRFLQTLEPLPEADALTHSERFGAKLNPAYPTDYQLPLYYLACRQDPEFGRALRAVALQVIRPAFADNPYQGAIRLAITDEQIEACQERMIQDINRYIVSPMLESAAFEPNPSQAACSGCAYLGICEAGDGDGLLEDGAE